MPKPTAAEIADENARTTSLGLTRYAIEYFASAMAADDAIGQQEGHEIIAPMPVNHMMAIAIELSLKAFLRERGVDAYELKNKYGHDLVLLFERARAEGLTGPWTSQEEGLLAILNKPYKAREFQYIKTGARTLPVFGPLTDLAVSILRASMDGIPFAKNFLRRDAGLVLAGFL